MSGELLELDDPIAQPCVVEWSGSLLLVHGLLLQPCGQEGQLGSSSIFLRPYISSGMKAQTVHVSITFLITQLPIPLLITGYAPYVGTAIVQPGGYGTILDSRYLGCVESGFSAFFPTAVTTLREEDSRRHLAGLGHSLPLLVRPQELQRN